MLPGRVEEIRAGAHPSVVLVPVAVGDSCLLARLTARSADALALAPGKTLWVQVKSVAIIE